MPKTLYSKIVKEFYKEPKNSLDIVFVGDSSVYTGISPMQLWEEHGIASYDLGLPTQRVWDSYYWIKEVFRYQKPKLIVIDTGEFFKESPTTPEFQRYIYDDMKIGEPKIQGITAKVQKNSRETVISYLFPVARFHSRWSELADYDFLLYEGEYPSVYKGQVLLNGRKPYIIGKKKKRILKNMIRKNVAFYLEKIKNETELNNAKLVLVSVPNPKTWNDDRAKEINDWAIKHNVDFIDLNDTSKVDIDWLDETEDAGIHLNWKGAKRVTSYLGNYLTQKYRLVNHKSEKEYEQWFILEKSFKEYIKSIDQPNIENNNIGKKN